MFQSIVWENKDTEEQTMADHHPVSRPMDTNLVPIVVHGHQAVDVVDVATSGQLPHQVRLDCRLRALVARGGCETFHADGTVLVDEE